MPEHLHVTRVEGEVCASSIDPVADARREARPEVDIAHDALATLRVEGGDAVPLDILLAGEVELLLDLKFDREPVRVPAGPPGYPIAAHRLVARNGVFEGATLEVVERWLAISRRRALVEDEVALG